MSASTENRVLLAKDLSVLFESFQGLGFRVLGPRERDGAIVYDTLDGPDDLPKGRRDEQAGGHYRLTESSDEALFAYTTAAQSWKRHLHPPEARLWSATKNGDGFTIDEDKTTIEPMAFLGVRPCELAAISIQDKVFDNGDFKDPIYAARREKALIIVAQCTHAAATCFCASMGSGPKADTGFDLAFTELDGGRLLFEPGSPVGAKILQSLPTEPASDADETTARTLQKEALNQQRRMDPDHRDILGANLEHAHWDDVAKRCLSCGNCTMVCPTCFCTTVEDVTELNGQGAGRQRKWDSCFSVDFSYIHGGSVRHSTGSRYRQWITHKLTSWHEQFGTSGCVGCGRCITWCPVGIDITAEVSAIKNHKGED